jgi:hypothetical protein
MRGPADEHALTDPTTSDVSYLADEVEYARALDRFKRENNRPFPTCREQLRVLASLGYRKTADPTPLPRMRKEREAEAKPRE